MIRKVRMNKIESGLQLLQGPMTVKLNNLSAMEVNTIRQFFSGALDRFWKLAKVPHPLAAWLLICRQLASGLPMLPESRLGIAMQRSTL